ncbi:MAG: S46 family peptidase [Pirellulaceae bacterium]|nr:S46 family peptidase [Pirellulaceae bacterium]
MYKLSSAGLFLVLTTNMICNGDEGMWLFNQLPTKHLAETHRFTVTPEWTEHLMLSSVRFNSGGSASFVSSNGLVLTNHHVASDTLYKLSTAEHNYNEDGFLAKSFAQEIKAPDLELNQLVSIEDVTQSVNSAVKTDMLASQAAKARQSKMSEIEKESLDKTGLRSDIVTLFGGGRYHLYRYKKYTDVRLVWAPEAGTAFFGGDADNFEYPRYCLDVTLFRVYENNEPANITHFLRTEPQGATDGDLIFVSGNPGRTRRIYTSAALAYQRDVAIPRTLNLLRRKENLLQQYALAGPEALRRARDDLFGVQNSRKAYVGMLQGLQEPEFFQRKRRNESDLIRQLKSDPTNASLAEAWPAIEDVVARRKALVGITGSLKTRLYSIAQTLVLMASEDQKPSTERLRDFRDSNRESLEQELYSPAPIYDDLERVQLADELARFMEDRGGDDALVVDLLDGKGPRDRAMEALSGTKLFDIQARQTIARGGVESIENSKDTMIVLAKLLEPEFRRLEELNNETEELERQAYGKISQAQFAIQGDSIYPDATFTLRLTYGVVAGYEVDGQKISHQTTLGGAFDHSKTHLNKEPWILPDSWNRAREKIAASTPFNFVCTADIIGGNSGSPVVNRDGAIVGIIFDGNIQSLTADFYYTDRVSRAVAVHMASVLESLRSIYNATELADQLGR